MALLFAGAIMPRAGRPGNAATSRSASWGGKILGRVRGTRTSGTVRECTEPPCRRVSRPRGSGLTCTGVSPRTTAAGIQARH